MIAPEDAVTVPVPVPVLETDSVKLGMVSNVAVTAVGDVPTFTVQVPVPEHPPPLQEVNLEPAAGVAVSVTELPLLNSAEQVAPQLIPAGELLTAPDPVPASVTETAKEAGMKLAVTVVAAVIVTEQVPTPEQPPPLQPANTDAAEVGVAVNVTTVPCR